MATSVLSSTRALANQDEAVLAVIRRDEAVLAVIRRIEFAANCPKRWINVSDRKYVCDVTTTVGLNADQRRLFVSLIGKFNPVWSVANKEPVIVTLRRGTRIRPDDMTEKLVAIAAAILDEERHLTATKRAIVYDGARRERETTFAQ